MRFFVLALLGLLGMVAAAGVQGASAGPSGRFEGRDLFSLQWATDPQIRPDGKAIAYVRNSYDILSDRAVQTLWLIDIDSGAQAPLVSGPGSHFSPRWSPDGKRLAYISTSENGHAQLFVRWMSSGQSARITDLTATPSEVAWSRDGRLLAFVMLTPDEKPKLGSAPPKPEGAKWAEPLTVITDLSFRADGAGYLEPGFTHVFVVSAEGGAPRQLTFGPYNEQGPLSWAPDGRSLLVTGNRTELWRHDPVNTEIYRVAVADSAITPLTSRAGPDREPKVSPDGSRIAYLGFDDRVLGYQNVRLYVMDRDGHASHSLTDGLDRTVDAAEWAADGRSVYIRYVDKGVTKVGRVRLDGGPVQPIADGLAGGDLDRPYSGGTFTVAANGTVAFTSGAPDHPADVAVARGGKVTRLTRLNDGLFEQKPLAQVKPLAVKSSFDQRDIDAWVVTPAGFDPARKYPLILEIHGGPFASYGPVFSTDDQLYAAAGYVVLYTNPRGSTSYGEEFANLIHHDYPGHDYDDLMSAVDAAVATGSIDTDQLFVTGGSGGGVLTAWIVGKTHRFRAAAVQKPVINWASWSLTTDIYTYAPKYWFGKLPWEDPEGYWKRSPLSLVGNVATPTLLVVGEQDFRTPVSDSEQYYEALQLRGIPTALVKVPGASHGGLAARPSQSAAKASAILAWFERYRTGTPPAPGTPGGAAAEPAR
jgi:dipeptidyl aminopeptidase/acylaminoacyl peptidase